MEGARYLKLKNHETGDHIVLDAEENSITIEGSTHVSIRALGAIDLQANQVSIRGRLVRPIAAPI